MTMRRMMAVLVLGVAGAMGAQAQMGGMAMPAGQSGAMESPAKGADGLLGFLEPEFMGVAKAMPADKYDFTPASLNIAGAKFDGVRTFADEVRHVAQANYFFGMTLSGTKPDVDVKAIGSLKTKDEIVAAAEKSFAFLHKAYTTLTPATAGEVVKFEGTTASKAEVAAFSVAHGYDHYGQMVEYLRMNGMVPPGSK